MKPPKFAIWMLILSLSSLIPRAAFGGKPMISISDLDTVIGGLPRKPPSDPVECLERRLKDLRSSKSLSTEKAALTQAVALIRIARQIRITSSPASRPLVVSFRPAGTQTYSLGASPR